MSRLPIVLPLYGVSFETAVSALAKDPGFVAIDARAALTPDARYSIVASHPARTLAFSGGFVSIDGHTVIDNPADALAKFVESARELPTDSYLPFCGGGIGYVGFEGVRALCGFEPASGFSRFPQCRFGMYTTAVIFDRLENSACVVSNGKSASAALDDAEAVVARLDDAPAWRPSAAPQTYFTTETRLIPDDQEFAKLLSEALLWLRTDTVKTVGLSRSLARPAAGIDPVEFFLSSRDEGAVRALFLHEGAAAITSSRGQALQHAEKYSPARQGVMEIVASLQAAGRPADRAMTFLGMNDKTHRNFCGGLFGTFDSKGIHFRTIGLSRNIVDETISVTAQTTMTHESEPKLIAQRLTQVLASC